MFKKRRFLIIVMFFKQNFVFEKQNFIFQNSDLSEKKLLNKIFEKYIFEILFFFIQKIKSENIYSLNIISKIIYGANFFRQTFSIASIIFSLLIPLSHMFTIAYKFLKTYSFQTQKNFSKTKQIHIIFFFLTSKLKHFSNNRSTIGTQHS